MSCFLCHLDKSNKAAMARVLIIWALLIVGCCSWAKADFFDDDRIEYMSRNERETHKKEAREMFYHAYNAYMNNAYPADELMPLSCKGRYRGSEPNRGDIDSALGNFSLTLVDTLDTLVVLGDFAEFERAVKLVIKDVTFDTDVMVSLFETNIRMLGGLLSAHILTEYLQQRVNIMHWYKGELLDLAKDLGYRFLPAFNTTTGIPYGRINLRYGMKGIPSEMSRETCTACAGSMILEMAALSRLTGESIFEEKAQKAMDALWRLRHRGTDLMGSVLNVNSGDWVRRDSGVGAGIDSYYEYCLKAYILLGDEKYLGRFNRHYEAVMKYISQGPMLLDVHMHRPNTNSKNFMDALLAFWPGLQVLKGDIKPAVETHEMLYQVMQRHNFIPEAFTTDFQVHWGHHPLRPEFLESTYFLYRATGDHYYLGVGHKVLTSLQKYAKVPCGYAAVSDVRTNKHDDTMDSFVLSETFKYLYLLFTEPTDMVLDLDEFIFTTEGHLLPLSLASINTNTSTNLERDVHVDELDRTCPNSLHLFPASVRQPLRNMVEDVCPSRPNVKRRLSASQFQATNTNHLKILNDMGITVLTLTDGRVQLLQTFTNAKTPIDAEEGILFMQEMVELSKMRTLQTKTRLQTVSFVKPNTIPPQEVTLLAGPAHFGVELHGNQKITGKVKSIEPTHACTEPINAEQLKGMIVLMERGDCMFIEKARIIQNAGAIGGIVLDNVKQSSVLTSPMFAMSSDGKVGDDVTIPIVFLFNVEANQLIQAVIATHGTLSVTIGGYVPRDEVQLKAPTDLSIYERLKGTFKDFLNRQISPQNLQPLELAAGETKERDQKFIVYDYLQASIVGEPNQAVFVNIVTEPTMKINDEFTNVKRSNLENEWVIEKQVMIDKLFGSTRHNGGLLCEESVLSRAYKNIMKVQGEKEDVIEQATLETKIIWLLKELTEVTPDPEIVKFYDTLDYEQHYLISYMFSVLSINYLKIRQTHPEFDQFASMSEEELRANHHTFLKELVTAVLNKLHNESAPVFDYLMKHITVLVKYVSTLGNKTFNHETTDNVSDDDFAIVETVDDFAETEKTEDSYIRLDDKMKKIKASLLDLAKNYTIVKEILKKEILKTLYEKSANDEIEDENQKELLNRMNLKTEDGTKEESKIPQNSKDKKLNNENFLRIKDSKLIDKRAFLQVLKELNLQEASEKNLNPKTSLNDEYKMIVEGKVIKKIKSKLEQILSELNMLYDDAALKIFRKERVSVPHANDEL